MTVEHMGCCLESNDGETLWAVCSCGWEADHVVEEEDEARDLWTAHMNALFIPPKQDSRPAVTVLKASPESDGRSLATGQNRRSEEGDGH